MGTIRKLEAVSGRASLARGSTRNPTEATEPRLAVIAVTIRVDCARIAQRLRYLCRTIGIDVAPVSASVAGGRVAIDVANIYEKEEVRQKWRKGQPERLDVPETSAKTVASAPGGQLNSQAESTHGGPFGAAGVAHNAELGTQLPEEHLPGNGPPSHLEQDDPAADLNQPYTIEPQAKLPQSGPSTF